MEHSYQELDQAQTEVQLESFTPCKEYSAKIIAIGKYGKILMNHSEKLGALMPRGDVTPTLETWSVAREGDKSDQRLISWEHSLCVTSYQVIVTDTANKDTIANFEVGFNMLLNVDN